MSARTALVLALLAASLPAQAGLGFQEASARDPESGDLLYTEQHLLRHQDQQLRQRLVVYRCANGTAFARKRIDYADSALAPAFHFEDARLGYREGLRREAGGQELWVQPSPAEAERSAKLEAGAGVVADAGFDEFIRRQWQPLLAGDAVKLQFAVPSRLDSYGFTVRRRGSDRVGGEDAEVFRLRLGGLWGLLAPHIDVAYARESRRLLRFEGLSNLRDEAGEPLQARIDFPAPARPAGEARWQALASEPLSACRVRG
ncbi:hypothetical protein [Arenimonas donghaensis]|uniref:hypothetical protein n=1 Tax=Arenimonas donghaensis TaxID=375061 RepID=UPI001268D6D4|nr:hypothetical protein [Arenimonas donghaensis]